MNTPIGDLARRVVWCVVFVSLTSLVQAGQGPENIAVVINGDSPVSKWIANEYIAVRQIPPQNVIYLSGLPGRDRLSIAQFREQMLLPVLHALEGRQLTGQIDGITYSADLPWAVDLTGEVETAGRPYMNDCIASSTGLTYLYAFVLNQVAATVDPASNRYYRRPVPLQPDSSLTNDENVRQGEVLQPLFAHLRQPEPPATNAPACAAYATQLTALAERAAPVLDALAAAHPNLAGLQYLRAGVLATCGQTNAALMALTAAVAAGWNNPADAKASRLHAPLRTMPAFTALLEKMVQQVLPAPSSLGFRGTFGWGPTGQPVPPNAGPRYLLTTMLAVTTPVGNKPAEAIAGLRRSVAADRTHPAGTIYYMKNADIRSTVREPLFASAAQALKQLGVRVEVRDGVLPANCTNVAGAMIGAANFTWTNAHSRILPGAICEHLTSFGAVMDNGEHTKLSEFLRYGAAGASGTVSEPFALDFKFPNAFLHVHYARGSTLAEAFYQSVASPYELLIVGDPLCQPWATDTAFEMAGLKNGDILTTNTTLITRVIGKVALVEYYCDGQLFGSLAPGQPFTLPVVALFDGGHDLAVVAVSDTPVQTRTRRTYHFRVNRTGHKVTLATTVAGLIPHDAKIPFTVQAVGAANLVIQHNGRIVAISGGSTAKFEVSAAQLGPGPVRLRAIAEYRGEPATSTLSLPLDLTIAPPTSH